MNYVKCKKLFAWYAIEKVYQNIEKHLSDETFSVDFGIVGGKKFTQKVQSENVVEGKSFVEFFCGKNTCEGNTQKIMWLFNGPLCSKVSSNIIKCVFKCWIVLLIAGCPTHNSGNFENFFSYKKIFMWRMLK